MTPTNPLTIAKPVDLATGTWDIDQTHSNVEFVARHLFSTVPRRQLGQFGGVIATSPMTRRDSTIEVTIEASSIETNLAEHNEHLRGEHFLDVDQFPTLTFASTSITPVGDGSNGQIEGLLTIAG